MAWDLDQSLATQWRSPKLFALRSRGIRAFCFPQAMAEENANAQQPTEQQGWAQHLRKTLSSRAPTLEEKEAWRFVVGQHLYIAGTGKWWSGQHFGAVVVDIRDSDDTVKVRYTDGGFKRFPADVLRTLVTEERAMPKVWEEWQTSVQEEQVSEMNKLHEDIMDSVRKNDISRAAELKKEFQVLSERKDQLNELYIKLLDAVNAGNYLEAHALQVMINKVQGKPEQEHSTPPQVAAASSAGPVSTAEPQTLLEFLKPALERALGGGLAGASAMVLQVGSFMWLRTTMNYQYRFGLSTTQALQKLYGEGGILRFYRGIGPALVQGPLSRFTDTAANAGVFAFFEGTDARHWPAFAKTVFASAAAASVRVLLVPLDTVKTIMQVEGKDGISRLVSKYRIGGSSVLFHGATVSSVATFVSHYPWFVVFNTMDAALPMYTESRGKQLLRNASIGFAASACSDTVTNSLRVLKTYRQTHDAISYAGIARSVVAADGYLGLFGRGLRTRLLANGCSGMTFSVFYKLFEEHFFRKT